MPWCCDNHSSGSICQEWCRGATRSVGDASRKSKKKKKKREKERERQYHDDIMTESEVSAWVDIRWLCGVLSVMYSVVLARTSAIAFTWSMWTLVTMWGWAGPEWWVNISITSTVQLDWLFMCMLCYIVCELMYECMVYIVCIICCTVTEGLVEISSSYYSELWVARLCYSWFTILTNELAMHQWTKPVSDSL